jgi:hypothetical protein
MRGTLRTVGMIVFWVVIVVSTIGCRGNPENREASASQAQACGSAQASGKSADDVITLPAGFDPTRPVSEPNEFRSPSRPPIIYRPRASILPLSGGQVEDIKSIVRKETQREIWFILVESHGKDSHLTFYPYRVEAYTLPDCQSGRIRRGSVVCISEELRGPRIQSSSYAHVCETAEAFPPGLAPPNDLTRLPFKIFADISDEDIIEVVRFIRSGPSYPVATFHNSSGTRQLFSRDPSLDPSLPIEIISGQGEDICVHVTGPKPYIFAVYHCRKVDGVWTVVRVERGVT